MHIKQIIEIFFDSFNKIHSLNTMKNIYLNGLNKSPYAIFITTLGAMIIIDLN